MDPTTESLPQSKGQVLLLSIYYGMDEFIMKSEELGSLHHLTHMQIRTCPSLIDDLSAS